MKKMVFVCTLMMMGALLGGCAKKGMEDEARAALTVPADAQQGADLSANAQNGAAETSSGKKSAAAEALETIYFAFDSFLLSEESRKTLVKNAQWIKTNSGVGITIEGHADDRGSDEYNLALGEKRALAVKEYLVNLGIAAERLSTISYGEEKPVVKGDDESAWSKNRRADFL